VEEGKWLNGVIEAMFVDLSVTVRESESKMVHTDIQRPQVNPVMPKGIDAYKKVNPNAKMVAAATPWCHRFHTRFAQPRLDPK
jgi:hypothetical protein